MTTSLTPRQAPSSRRAPEAVFGLAAVVYGRGQLVEKEVVWYGSAGCGVSSRFWRGDTDGGRGSEGRRVFLEEYEGYLQTDAYSGYNVVFETGRVIRIACWAHAATKGALLKQIADIFRMPPCPEVWSPIALALGCEAW